jgi:acetyl esterase/lipase
MARPWRAGSIVVAGLLSACSPTTIVNSLVPRSGYQVEKDVAYGPEERQRLDVYRPTAPGKSLPVVVFFYGGNWESGDKSMYLFAGEALASRGFIAVIADYRLYPQVRFPAFLEDAARAVAWTSAHVDELGGDRRRLYLMGHSAGAYIAAMLTLDYRWLDADGLDPRRAIAGTVGLAGPYDFLPLRSATLKAIFGPEAQWPATQPINYVRGDAPPMLLATGTDDTTVGPYNSENLAERIRSEGGRVSERYYKGVGHAPLVGALAWPLRFTAPVLADAVQFMNGGAARLGAAPDRPENVGGVHAAAP